MERQKYMYIFDKPAPIYSLSNILQYPERPIYPWERGEKALCPTSTSDTRPIYGQPERTLDRKENGFPSQTEVDIKTKLHPIPTAPCQKN
jgi:hypothetical protein